MSRSELGTTGNRPLRMKDEGVSESRDDGDTHRGGEGDR
jgi:hypothetical protein